MNDGNEEVGFEEARERLAEAERVQAMLEARLLQYQRALETIRSVAGKVLDT